MNIVITEWALQSYLELYGVFTTNEYQEKLRPDAKLLKEYPDNLKFKEGGYYEQSTDSL